MDTDSETSSLAITQPLPQFLVAPPGKSFIVSRVIDALSSSFEPGDDTPKILKDVNDTFHFHESNHDNTKSLLQEFRAPSTIPNDSTSLPKHIVIHRDDTFPSKDNIGPHFNIESFFQHLQSTRPPEISSSDEWHMGEALLFSSAVTSTQTLLEKNPKFLSSLPTPILSVATHQLSGRGRGSNVWVSPAGCLQFSLHLRIPNTQLPASKVVFVQYLFALAVCEAVRDESVLGDGEREGDDGEGWRVRLKWPNDIYALVGPRGGEEKKKIGGILVNTSFSGGNIDIVIGCGLNVLNPLPTTSLSHLLRKTGDGGKRRKALSLECTAAVIIVKFQEMWNKFIASKGFEPFIEVYLKRWLQSDQLITLTTVTPPIQVRITGITLDYGLLRTIPERGTSNPYFSRETGEQEQYIDLQPDGNSFDLMAGLIKAK